MIGAEPAAPKPAKPKRVKHWQKKHISDELVCVAVAHYNHVMKASNYRADEPFPYEKLAEITGAPEKVTYAACERACDRELIEYGVSLRTGWLTDKGKALVDAALDRRAAALAAQS